MMMAAKALVALACLLGAAEAKVHRCTSADAFKRIIHEKADGLPVVVDFFSDGCGPCRMIAPVYQAMSNEYKGRAIFVKVDIQRDNVGVQISSMPTFQFYYNGKMMHQFSGADEQGIRRQLDMLGGKAKAANFDVTKKDLVAFYDENDVEKVEKVDEIMKKFGPGTGKTASLFRKLKKKYGKEPKKTERPWPRPPKARPGQGKLLKDYTTEELKGEMSKRDDDEGASDDEVEVKQRKRRRKLEKVVVIGGGPAGLTAAIYAARAGLKPVVVSPQMGGQLMSKGVDVENYPGLVRSTGTKMVTLMRQQAAMFATEFEFASVTNVDLSKHPFVIDINGTTIATQTIIVATGADSKWLDVPGEDKYKGMGVSSCATCDGFLFKGKPVLVVGGGDTAMEEALVLARICSKVTLVHRKDSFRASQVLATAVKQHKKITVVWDTVVESFDGSVTAVQTAHLKNVKTGAKSELKVDAAFVAIGHIPNTWLFKGALDMDPTGYLNTVNRTTHTSLDGVFAAGDVADHVYRQAVTSAGTGSMAALDAERWLSERGLALSDEEVVEGGGAIPNYMEWRVKKLRKLMNEKKISAKGCVEKKDFVDKLKAWHAANPE